MDHDDNFYHQQRIMMMMAADPAAAASSSSSPGNNTSWDSHYKRRGRTRERFDYALTSEEISPEVPEEKYAATASGAGRPQRPRSANDGPQHHRPSAAASGASVSTGSSSKNRATCLQNMFHPGETNNGMAMMMPPSTVVGGKLPPTTPTTIMGQPYDDEGVRYYPSERYNVPAASLSDTGVIDDVAMAYATSRQRAMGHMLGHGRPLRHDTSGGGENMHNATYRDRPDSGGRSSQHGMPETYHPSTRRMTVQQQRQHPRPGSLYYTRELRYHDYVKENLIMYGEGLQDAPSASTGLSQEELLQRKRREETWQKRREKRQQQKKSRVVNLPSSLFPAPASSGRPSQQQHSSAPPTQPDHFYGDMERKTNLGHRNGASKNRSKAPLEKPFEDGGLAGISYHTSKSAAVGRDSVGGHKSDDGEKDTETAQTRGSGGAKGVRGLMVRRQRSDSNSSGRRWKILPSLAGKSKSHVPSPIKGRKQDPPAASASSRTKYPRDPPSVHSGNAASAIGESKTNRDEFFPEGNPTIDEFDRFMENPNIMAGKATRAVSFDPRNDTGGDDYLISQTLEQSSPNRPSYANFTPKSEYSASRGQFSPDAKPVVGKKTSPTSVMDVQNGGTTGVRWSENLFEQQFVSPHSARLDPFATDRFQYGTRSKPKSILRKGAARGLMSSRRNAKDFFPFDEGKECPSDESPSKSSTRTGNASRMFADPPTEDDVPRISSPLGFIDGNGRSVSPILAESPSEEHDVLKTMAGWAESHRNNSFEIPSQHHNSDLPSNFGMNQEHDPGQLSNSYVDFIEAVASVVIQTKVRQLLARNKVENLRNQQCDLQETQLDITGVPPALMQRRSEAITQKARSASKEKQTPKTDAALDFYSLAAIRIQAIFRGWWVRDCLAIDNYCATMIQKVYRGWLAVDASITRLYCIVRMQSLVRGFLVRKRLGESAERDVYGIAATIIQAQWRSFSCEMKYLRAYEDILVVQSVARGWITRRLIASWLTAHHRKVQRTMRQNADKLRLPSGHRERFQQQQAPQSTPPRKPSKVGNELSPSYLPHIEYMRNTLAPGSQPRDLASPSRVQPRKSDTFQQRKWNAREVSTKETPKNDAAPKPSVARNSIGEHHRRTLQQQVNPAHRNVNEQLPERQAETFPTARSEIEQRRKNKELEAKAREAEEKRRQESQAAELAELEFRRKRMAMKAEARKKEENEAEIPTLPAQQPAHPDIEPVPSDCCLYNEEKKESDSIINSFVESHPMDEPNDTSNDSSPSETVVSPPIPAPQTTTKFGPWQLKKRTTGPTTSSNQDLEKPRYGQATQKSNMAEPNQVQGGNRPPFIRNGSVVAARKQQLFMSNGNGTSTTEHEEVTSVDVAEMNSIVGEKKVATARKSLMGSTATDEVDDVDISNIDDEQQPAVEEALSLGKKGVDHDPKDVDVSALTEPTSASPMASSTAPAPSKRVSGTSASYVEQMRSQRSEAEQKRLDEMHAIFSKAGLMHRTKRTK